MGLIDTIYKWLGINKDASRVAGVLTSPYRKDWIQYNGGDYTTADISTINACCQIIGDTLASAELRMYNTRGDVVSKDKAQHAFVDNLLKGNELMGWDEIVKLTFYYIALTGACYWYVDWGFGKYPAGYYPLAGGKYMKFKLDEFGKYKTFEYSCNGVTTNYDASQIIVFKNVSSDPRYALTGKPIAAGCDYAIQELIGFHDTRMSTLENGSKPSAVLETKEFVPLDERKTILDQFKQVHGGTKNANKLGMLPYGLTYTKIDEDLETLMYLAPMDDVKREICEVFRVPPAMLGTVGAYNKANIDAAKGVYITMTAQPKAKMFENPLIKHMNDPRIGLKGYRMEMYMEVPKDDEAYAKTINTHIMSGVMTPNEGRKELNLPPIPSGEYQLVPVNVSRVDTQTGEMKDQVFTDPATGAGTSKPTDDKKQKKDIDVNDTINELMFLTRRGFKKDVAVLSIDLKKNLRLRGYEGVNLEVYELACNEIDDILDKAKEKGYGVDWINDKIKKSLYITLSGVE